MTFDFSKSTLSGTLDKAQSIRWNYHFSTNNIVKVKKEVTRTMEQRPESEQTPYGEYRGQPPQQSSDTPYSADEMPQSSYPHDGPTPSAQDPYGSTGYQQSSYGQ